jgi:hypothetical protein
MNEEDLTGFTPPLRYGVLCKDLTGLNGSPLIPNIDTLLQNLQLFLICHMTYPL